MSTAQQVNISTRTILKILAVAVVILFLYAIRDVLLIVFVALVLAAAISPSITKLERRGIPRGLGLALIYLGLILLLAVIIFLVVPLVTDELAQFTRAFPDLYQKGFAAFQSVQHSGAASSLEKTIGSINDTVSQLTKGLFSGVVNFFGGLFSVIGILVLTFYLTIENKGMKPVAVDLAPAKYRPYLTQLFNRIEARLGQWLRGQLLLGLIIATLIYVALLLLHIKYALVLALIAGVTELLPIIGPFIGAIPAVIVALSQDPLLALWTVLAYILVQQLENHLIVPRVMSKATGLNPVVVIIAVLIGAKLAGITGIILAVPTVIIVSSFVEDFFQQRHQADTELARS